MLSLHLDDPLDKKKNIFPKNWKCTWNDEHAKLSKTLIQNSYRKLDTYVNTSLWYVAFSGSRLRISERSMREMWESLFEVIILESMMSSLKRVTNQSTREGAAGRRHALTGTSSKSMRNVLHTTTAPGSPLRHRSKYELRSISLEGTKVLPWTARWVETMYFYCSLTFPHVWAARVLRGAFPLNRLCLFTKSTVKIFREIYTFLVLIPVVHRRPTDFSSY